MKIKITLIFIIFFLSLNHLFADIYDEYKLNESLNKKNYFMSNDFDAIVRFNALLFDNDSLDNTALQKIIKKIKSYQEKKEILISIIGHTTDVKDANESKKIAMGYAQSVQEYLLNEGFDKKLIVLESRGSKDPRFSDATQSKRVMVTLYVKKDADLDNDGVVNKLDSCPNTVANVKVSKNGCKFNTVVMLLDNNKGHNAIVLTTGGSQLEINKVNTYVVVKSSSEMSEIKDDMSEEEKKRLFGNVVENKAAKFTKFILYFNKLDILESSKKELKIMLDLLSQRSDYYIKIIGHTDTKGSFKINDALSQKRAQKVKGLINNANIKYLQIDIEAYGEYDLAVKTTDNIVESLNRRTEIFIH